MRLGMNGEHGIQMGGYSLRVRLVKGQAHLAQAGGHLQVRSGDRKEGIVRKEDWARTVWQSQDH